MHSNRFRTKEHLRQSGSNHSGALRLEKEILSRSLWGLRCTCMETNMAPCNDRNIARARKTWVLRAKAYGHTCKKGGKRESSKALRRVGKAICRAHK